MKDSGSWSGLRDELERFIEGAEDTEFELAQPLDAYLVELSGILRKHLSIQVDNRGK